MNDKGPKRQHKRLNLPRHELVRGRAAWQRCLQRLQREPRIAVDLEANSMYAYRERICLIQVSIPRQDYILDPLGDFELDGFGKLIEDATVEKVFHAAEYDLMLMKREFGWQLSNLFDTQWAARILGVDRVGLANVLKDVFGVSLDKRYQRANWCRRPLSAAQLAYAQADTHFLLRLRDHYAEALRTSGRWTEAQEIFEEQSRVELPDLSFDPDGFWQITGANRLSAQGVAVLKALHIYRDAEARHRDLPHFKVLQDRTLLELAQVLPEDIEDLSQIHGMSKGQVRRYGKNLLRLIDENRAAPRPKRPPRPERMPEAVVNRYEALHDWRKERAQTRGVESDVIISRDALWRLARANPHTQRELQEINGLGPWRLATYGQEILGVLNGEKG